MAYSKKPTESTYQTKMFPLFKEINSRGVFASDAKDNNYVNVFPNFVKNKVTQENFIDVLKRAGCSSVISAIGSSGEQIRGIYDWREQNKLFIVVGRSIYIYNSTSFALIATLVNRFAAGTTEVGFDLFQFSSGVTKVVATDGSTLLTIDSANADLSSSGHPTHLPYPVFLNGYIFVIAANTADIYNSNQDDPLTWTAGDFITAEILGDNGTYLCRLNNYLLAFGNKSIEYFWDAAVATGSPLQRNDTPVKLMGYAGGFARLGNKVFFVGAQNNANLNVFLLEEMKANPVSDETVREHLNSLNVTFNTTLKGNIVSMFGREFYVLYADTKTWVMEVETQLWHRWTFQGSVPYFAMTYANTMVTNTETKGVFAMLNDRAIYKFSDTLYQDAGTNFTCTITTDKENFGSHVEKTMSRAILVCDRPSTSSNVNISWTDDDYQTFSTVRQLDINSKKPAITQLGSFNERAFKITYTDNLPFRVSAIEVNINIGSA